MIPNEKIIDKAIELLPKSKPGKLLDVGMGNGLLCLKARNLGHLHLVYACDINPQEFEQKDIPFKKTALNNKLPFLGASFDYLTCTKVLEHLKNSWQVINEIAQVTKKNGYLALSLPNFTSLISQFVFFVRGNFRYFDDWTRDNWEHINPIAFTELEIILTNVGFKVEKIDTQEEIGQLHAFFPSSFTNLSQLSFVCLKLPAGKKTRSSKLLAKWKPDLCCLAKI